MAPRTATNIRLPTGQWKRLKAVAAEEGLSLAGLVSEMAETYLHARDEKLQPSRNDSFFRIGEDPGDSGRADTSESHDAVLYPPRAPQMRRKRTRR